MSVSRLDQLYRKLLLTKFFTKGWGKPDNLKRIFDFRKRLSDREQCQHLVAADYPINIDKEYREGDVRVLEGHFLSPFVHHLPGIMPKEVEKATFQMILPVQWKHPTYRPVCVHLAGTGDHFFWRRRLFTARPLLKESGIASIILENPYYGTRKPKDQLRSSLHNVSDLFVMGGALVLESMALFHWCEREGWGPLGISGVSMGGHMASLAATNWTKPIPLIPILSWSTASCVFTQGVMSGAIPWHTLQEQFFKNSVYQEEIRKLIVSPEENRKAYEIGQQFAREYSMDSGELEKMHKQQQEKDQLRSDLAAGKNKKPLPDFSQGQGDLGNQLPLRTQADSISSLMDTNTGTQTEGSGPDVSSVFSSNVQTSGEQRDPQSKMSSEDNFVLGNTSVGNNLNNTNNTTSAFIASPELDLRGDNPNTPEILQTQPVMSSGITPSSLPNSVPPSSTPSSVPQTKSTSDKSSSTVTSSSSSSPKSSASAPQSERTTKRRSLTLSYAQSKTKSVRSSSSNTNTSKPNPLTLKHALAKSNLLVKKESSLPTDEESLKNLESEALDFMRGVMDECTHLGNFSVPVDPELIIIVLAKQDAYIPRDGVLGLDQLWPGCEVRYVDQGHVGAVLFNQAVFRKAIVDAFEKQATKYGYTNQPSLQYPAHDIES